MSYPCETDTQTDRHTDYMNAGVAFASAGIFRWDLMGLGWQAGLGQAN